MKIGQKETAPAATGTESKSKNEKILHQYYITKMIRGQGVI